MYSPPTHKKTFNNLKKAFKTKPFSLITNKNFSSSPATLINHHPTPKLLSKYLNKMNMEAPNVKMWTTIYPAYLNSALKKSEGRKLEKSKSVLNPTIMEISEVLSFFKILHCLENKAYSRDILQRGRVKVKLFDDNQKPLNLEIPNSTK